MSEQNIIDRLFAAGSHFGFKKSRRHPSMKPYIFGTKDGNDIFDLERTETLLAEAKAVLEATAKEGKTVVFVGTKEEASNLVRSRAEANDATFVVNRWVGGMITNWGEIKKRINRLAELVSMGESGELERKYTKKERVVIKRELDKLTFNFGGIRTLEKNPDLMVVVDPRHEKIAVNEAIERNIPVIAVMSSDNDAKLVNYPIVVNDTLQASLSLVLDELFAAYAAGKAAYVPKPSNTTTRRRVNR